MNNELLRELVADFQLDRPGFDPGSCGIHVVQSGTAAGFPEYFRFPCQFSFNRLLHTHKSPCYLRCIFSTLRSSLNNLHKQKEYRVGREVEVNNCVIISGTIPTFTLRDWENWRYFSAMIICVPTEVRRGLPPNTEAFGPWLIVEYERLEMFE
jgi:hypothetical protein